MKHIFSSSGKQPFLNKNQYKVKLPTHQTEILLSLPIIFIGVKGIYLEGEHVGT